MVNAYAAIENNGRGKAATLIDFVQDRHGKVILPEAWRACDGCNARDWDGKPMPRPASRMRQVIDAMTAYQVVHITEGVIQRGTATTLRDLDRPLFGKTGTNTGPTDVWFIGGTPQFIGGLYIGYDHPTGLGGYAQGGTIAAPIFKEFATKAYEGMEKLPFRAPRRHPHGAHRPGERPAGLWHLARHRLGRRPQAGGDLGSVQARERAAPRPPRRSRTSRDRHRRGEEGARPARQRVLAGPGRNLLDTVC